MIAPFVVAAVIAQATPAMSTTTPFPASPGPVTPAPAAAAPQATMPATPTATPATASPSATAVPTAPPPVMTTPPPRVSASPGGIVYAYRFVPVPSTVPDAPQIHAVYLNGNRLKAPGPIDIRVETSSDVVRVVSHQGKRGGEIAMVAPGRFESAGRLPKLPFIAHGVTVKLDFTATNAAGKTTTATVPIVLQ